jgi:hypothetical protein
LDQFKEIVQAKTFEKHFDENLKNFTSNTKCSEQQLKILTQHNIELERNKNEK